MIFMIPILTPPPLLSWRSVPPNTFTIIFVSKIYYICEINVCTSIINQNHQWLYVRIGIIICLYCSPLPWWYSFMLFSVILIIVNLFWSDFYQKSCARRPDSLNFHQIFKIKIRKASINSFFHNTKSVVTVIIIESCILNDIYIYVYYVYNTCSFPLAKCRNCCTWV